MNGDDGSIGEHGDLDRPVGAELTDHRTGQRRLAGAGRAGEADGVGVAAERMGQPADLATLLTATLDERQQAGQRGAIAGAGRTEQLGARSLVRAAI